MDMHNKIICIAGPTASGKTRLAIETAKIFGFEIVSADAFLIYRGLNTGTAKPTVAERQGIPHHMIDVTDAADDYSVARYVADASRCIQGIQARGHVPLLVGGSGLYMDSLIKGNSFAGFTSDGTVRRELEEKVKTEGRESIFELLSKHDPESATRLHINDTKRIIRALEVFFETGQTISQHNENTKKLPPRFNTVTIGLDYEDRAVLYEKIDARATAMIKNGLIDELKKLLGSGLSRQASSMQAIGYKELFPYLDGDITLDMALENIKRESRRYAKRQLTWFRRNPDINWIKIRKPDNFDEALRISTEFIKQNILL